MAVYQNLDCQLTLEEALEEFHRLHAELLYSREMTEDSETFFRCHDTAHVVFGCDISLANEGMVKIWTAFGTTLGFWRHIAAYSRPETREIAKEMSPGAVLATFFRLLVLIPRIILRCRAMSKRWPWSEHEAYLGRRLVDIRHELNIQPLIVA